MLLRIRHCFYYYVNEIIIEPLVHLENILTQRRKVLIIIILNYPVKIFLFENFATPSEKGNF